MKNSSTTPSAPRLGGRALLLAGLCVFLRLQSAGWADSLYSYTLNTAAISGQNGYLAFDLINGDAAFGNNTITAAGLSTDGTLSDASNVVLTDMNFFNEELRDITFGSTLHFSLLLTGNFVPPGSFDEFSFFLLDSGFLPIAGTSDPTGSDALLVVDIDGSKGGLPAVFDSSTSGHLAVPESGSTLALLTLALGAAGLGRIIRKQVVPALQH